MSEPITPIPLPPKKDLLVEIVKDVVKQVKTQGHKSNSEALVAARKENARLAPDFGCSLSEEELVDIAYNRSRRSSRLDCAAEIQMQPPEWLWEGRLSKNQLTHCAGESSQGKSPLNGSIAGHTVDLAIVDDICRNEKDAMSPTVRATISENFFSVISPRSKKIILVTTPWHLSDLAMENLRIARTNKAARQWTVVVLAATNDGGQDSYIEDTRTGEKQFLEPYEALWPEVHPRAELEEIKATMRDRKWQALYMCRPSVGANCLFPRDKWGTLGNFAPIAINWAWDFASGKAGAKNDYTVGCCVALMNNGRYAVLDVFRGKPDFPMMKQIVFAKWCETYERYKLFPQVFIEDASSGQQMLQEIQHANLVRPSMLEPIPVLPTHNKEMRAEAIASAQNNGQVDLPENAAWKEDFIRELEEFPLAEHDDCVDAYTWAQAGFVRGDGFFKPPVLPDGCVTYDSKALAEDLMADVDYQQEYGWGDF